MVLHHRKQVPLPLRLFDEIWVCNIVLGAFSDLRLRVGEANYTTVHNGSQNGADVYADHRHSMFGDYIFVKPRHFVHRRENLVIGKETGKKRIVKCPVHDMISFAAYEFYVNSENFLDCLDVALKGPYSIFPVLRHYAGQCRKKFICRNKFLQPAEPIENTAIPRQLIDFCHWISTLRQRYQPVTTKYVAISEGASIFDLQRCHSGALLNFAPL